MKLYYSPGACSLSPHIVLRELAIPFDLVKVDLRSHRIDGSGDYRAINPKGYVPALELDDGDILTEGPAIIQLLADQHPDRELAPPNGTRARAHLQEWLNFISTELHKQFSPLFNPKATPEVKAEQKHKIEGRLDYIDPRLADRPYLFTMFSVADAYLFTVLRWAKPMEIALDRWPNLTAYMLRMGARPAVQAALAAEKLT
jgi:glutathione S-transferase